MQTNSNPNSNSASAPAWSDYQLAIFDAATQTQDNLLVQAVAGSGKTTTLVELASRLSQPGLAVAFNKSIQLTLQDKFPQGWTCLTFNSLGHRAWGRYLSQRLKLDKQKILQILRDNPSAYGIEDPASEYDRMRTISSMVDAARRLGLVPDDAEGSPRGLIPDDDSTWLELRDRFDIEDGETVISEARKALRESIRLAFEGIIDFADQLYMPVCWYAGFDKHPIVVVDEAQDLDPLQHEILRRSLKLKGRIIAVGDRHQAIYGFRGADHRSMSTLSDLFSMRELPLSVSYRCPYDVVLEARKLVSQIEAAPGAPRGHVLHTDALEPQDLPPGSAIICRNTAPLMSEAWALIRAGISVRFLGREIGQQLIKICERHKAAPDIAAFRLRIRQWADAQAARYPRREGTIRDKADAVLALTEDAVSADEVISRIQALFDRESAHVTLCTGHKSKGLEWPHVFFLRPDLIPSQYAQTEHQLVQEDNLKYVIITRALETLTYVWS